MDSIKPASQRVNPKRVALMVCNWGRISTGASASAFNPVFLFMITPIHLIFDFGIYALANKTGIASANGADLLWMFSAELIDLDHLLSKPIYHPRRNPFQAHILHKNWKIILLIAISLFFFRPVLFLGIGLLSHLLLDYFYVKIYKIKDIK